MPKRRRNPRSVDPRGQAPSLPGPPRRFRRRWLLWGGLLGAALVAGGALRIYPRYLREQARAELAAAPAQAAERLERALLLAPGDDQARLLLCRAYVQLQHWEQAAGAWQALEGKSLSTADLLPLAAEALDHGSPGFAERVLREAEPGASDGQALGSLMMRVLFALGREGEALRQARELAESAPADPQPWRIMATVYHRRREVLPAMEALRELLRRDPPPAAARAARLELVELLIQTGNGPAAREALAPLLAEQPVPTAVLLQEAYVLRLEGKWDAALAAVEAARKNEPDSIAARMLLGVIQLDREKFAEAAAVLEEVVREQPYNKEAHYKLALAYRGSGQGTRAAQHFATSQKLVEASAQAFTLRQQLAADPTNEALARELAECLQILGQREP